MNAQQIAEMISKYGFPIVAAGGLGFMIHYVWKWVTTEAKPVISEASSVLIALIDRVRMLDNDLIRLNQKLNTVLQLRSRTDLAARQTYEPKSEEGKEAAGGSA